MSRSKSLNAEFVASGRRTVELELQAVQSLSDRIDQTFAEACRMILDCRGRVVVTGIGKSGHIARKIAATLASTGTPSLFLHPAEAGHGDIGMMTAEDLVLALSHSGAAPELVALLPVWKRLQVRIIALTGKGDSPLAEVADICLRTGVAAEACPLDLAPTSSTTASLVYGDALAVALLEARGFDAEDFAFSHPGGSLGKRLLLRVSDVMHRGEEIPAVDGRSSLAETLVEMSRRGFGFTAVIDAERHLLGVFTDGDLRRALEQGADLHRSPITELMTPGGQRIDPQQLAVEALNHMQEHKITVLLCTDESGRLSGVVHLHDLLRAGLV